MGEQAAEKKYLKKRNYMAYGIGNFGAVLSNNVITSFVMIYLANAVGLNTSIVGILMMISKVFDGISDIIFGGMIDKTHSKWGHARPWLIYTTIPLNIFLVLLFSVPQTTGWLPYAYFFIVYTLMQAVFYTANQISYSTLPLLITKNQSERVTLSVVGFVLVLLVNVCINGLTVGLTVTFGGGSVGWRNVAILYGIISSVCLFICGFGVKELPYENDTDEKMSINALVKGLKHLLSNKYYMWLIVIYIATFLTMGIGSAVGAFYYQYVLGNAELNGTFTLAGSTTAIGLLLAPIIVKKFGVYKSTVVSSIIMLAGSILYIPVAYMQNIPFMLLISAVKALPLGVISACLTALVGDVASYSLIRDNVHLEAMMSSCSSLGTKIGSGIGTALGGILVTISGFQSGLAVQSAHTQNIITFSNVVIPAILYIPLCIALYKCNVQPAIEKIRKKED